MTADLYGLVLLHAGCAAIYAVLVALILIRSSWSRTGLWLAGACFVTAAWAAAVALDVERAFDGVAGWLELARSVAWYGFILHLYRRSISRRKQLGQAFATMGLLAVLLIGMMPLIDIISARHSISLWSVGTAARLGIAVCNLLLIENLYFNTPPDLRWHINLLCIALSGLFLYDLVLYSDAVLFRRISWLLFEGRASVTAIVAPLLAIAAARNRSWAIDIHVSRTVVFHSATLVASGIFLLGLAAAGEIFRRGGAEWGYVAEVSLISGGVLVIAMLVTSGSARSRLRALVVDNFFTHRYDYRQEWMRCITTLSAPENYVGLQTRAIRAIAEVVDSPGGALFVRDPEDVAFQWAGSWNMPAVTMPVPRDHALVGQFRDGDWIVELDKSGSLADLAADLPRRWLAVPLSHLGQLIGFVVLARSRAKFKLEREVYDLLRIVGHEVASHVAEQRATQVLTDTRQLQEYSKRFAFVIHDIKNVSSQLSMLLSNAEVHADNPEFQRDMLNTVRSSVDKITRMLTRLQTREREHGQTMMVPMERLTELAAGYLRTRRITVSVDHDGRSAGVAMDPGTFEAVVSHLLDNAIEACEGGAVRIRVRHEALSVLVDIMDEGPGMTPEFIRDQLFRPFASTKRSGHGIGVYQSRELLREAGGDLLVFSKPNSGTMMRILLPSVGAAVEEASPLSA
jgi:putative PEP-CTERM system histidine kinase